jgi:hypothetical protein
MLAAVLLLILIEANVSSLILITPNIEIFSIFSNDFLFKLPPPPAALSQAAGRRNPFHIKCPRAAATSQTHTHT